MKGGFLNKLAHNKAVLYVILAFAVFTLLGYLVNNNLAAIILFLVVGFGTTYLTKNMIYVLLASILLTNFLVSMGFLGKLGIREGMDNDNKDDNSDDEDADNSDDEDADNAVNKVINSEQKIAKTYGKSKPRPSSKDDLNSNKPKNGKKKSNFANLDDDDMSVVKTRLDAQGTVENAYESLENILGGDGMAKMTGQASKLAQNQEGLLKAVEKMGPMMKIAENMLNRLEKSPFANLASGGSKNVGHNDHEE